MSTPASGVTRVQKRAPETESDFVSFKALSRSHLHLSSQISNAKLWTGPTHLFAVSNTLGWFAAGRDQSFILSPLRELREAFKDTQRAFQPRLTVDLGHKPIIIKFAHDRLIVAQLNGLVNVYDGLALRDPAISNHLPLLHTFAYSSEPIRDLQPNPSDKPELVAIVRGNVQTGTRVEIIDVKTFSLTLMTPDVMRSQQAQTCMSWSPKGKQIVVGNVSGELIQYTPDGVQKAVTSPPQVCTGWAVSSVIWMENTVFHTVYSSVGLTRYTEDLYREDYEPFTILNDKGIITEISHPDPTPAFGDSSREGARFFLHMRDWAPMKHILIVADPPSTDVGVVFCRMDDPGAWGTLVLEETSRVVLPTDEQGGDTYPIGVELDFTAVESVNMATFGGDETPPAPPSPILYVYASTGDLAAYHVLNSVSPSFPGMVKESPHQMTNLGSSTIMEATMSSLPASMPSSLSSNSMATPAFGQSGFGTAPRTSVFGQTSFGSAAPTFGALAPSSSFSTPARSASSFASSSSQGGFSAFANKLSGGFSAFTGGPKPAFASTTAQTNPTSVFGAPNTPTTTPAFGGFDKQQQPPTSVFSSLSFGSSPPAGSQSSAFGPVSSSSPTPFSVSSGFVGAAPPAQDIFGQPGSSALGTQSSAFSSSGAGVSVGMDVTNESPPNTPPSVFASAPFGSSPPSPSVIAPAKGFGAFGSFGTGTSAFAKAAQQSPSMPPQPTAFASGVSAFGGSGFPSTPPSSTPAFGAPSQLGAPKSVFGVTSSPAFGAATALGTAKAFSGSAFGTASSKPAEAAPAPNTPLSTSGFSAFRTGSGSFASLASTVPSTPAFAAPAQYPSTVPSVFGALQMPSTSTPTALTARTARNDNEEDERDKIMTSRFDEDVIGNQDPRNVAASGMPSGLSTPQAPVGLIAQDENPEALSSPPLSGLTLGSEEKSRSTSPFLSVEPSPTSTPPTHSPPPEPLSPGEASVHTAGEGPRAIESVTPEPGQLQPNEAEEEEEESTTPEGSPAKSSLPPRPVIVPPSKPTPIAPAAPMPPNGSLLSRLSPPASSPSPTLGLGRPSSVPSRFGVGSASPFVPAKSSPLAASPPISRKDVSDSPSPPKPVRASGGIFSKKPPSEPDDDEEEDFNDLLKKVQGSPVKAKAKVLPPQDNASGTTSTVVSQPPSLKPASVLTPSPPTISLPLSDEPKPVPRPKTPPLLSSFGFAGARKPSNNLSNKWVSSTSGIREDVIVANDPSASASTVAKAPVSAFANLSFPQGGISNNLPTSAVAPSPPQSLAPIKLSSIDVKSPSLFSESPKTRLAPPARDQPRYIEKVGLSTPVTPTSMNEMRSPEDSKPGINSEVNRIVAIMERELDQLRTIALQCSELQRNIIASKHGRTASFDDVSGWSLGDLKALRRETDALEDDTLVLEDQSLALKSEIAELQSLLLKAETNKQEAERFLRAREDKNFAKLLKVRALGPEHLENQTRLRRSIQLAHDRVQQLEDQIAAMKNKVTRAKAGESALKAPSLDVIARAIANIEIGALEKRNQMNALTERIEALDLDESFDPPSDHSEIKDKGRGRYARERTPLGDLLARSTITPRVTSATTAALNAERSAARLKSALQSVRPAPILNTSVVPKPVEKAKLDKGFAVSLAMISVSPRKEPAATVPTFPKFPGPDTLSTPPKFVIPPGAKLPPMESLSPSETYASPSPSTDTERRFRGSRTKQHTKSVPIRRSPEAPFSSTAASSSLGSLAPPVKLPLPAPAFSFGPLPTVNGPIRNPLMFGFGNIAGPSSIPTTRPAGQNEPVEAPTTLLAPKPEMPRRPWPGFAQTPFTEQEGPSSPNPGISARERQQSGAEFLAALAEEELGEEEEIFSNEYESEETDGDEAQEEQDWDDG